MYFMMTFLYILAGKKQKVEHLWKLEGATESLKLVQADLMEENSFDNAIIGCKGVFHIASPVPNHIIHRYLYVTTYKLMH